MCQCCVLAGRRLTRERRRTREGRRGLHVRHLSLGKIVMRVERLEAFANLLEQLFPDAGLKAEGRRQTLGWRWALGLWGEARLACSMKSFLYRSSPVALSCPMWVFSYFSHLS